MFGAEFWDADFIAIKVPCSRMSDELIHLYCTVQWANFAGMYATARSGVRFLTLR
jgi:hypothetical protein